MDMKLTISTPWVTYGLSAPVQVEYTCLLDVQITRLMEIFFLLGEITGLKIQPAKSIILAFTSLQAEKERY